MNVPKLRFKDTDEREFCDWKSSTLGELAKIFDGTHTTPDYKESGIPFYSVEHVTADNFSDTKFISREVFERENKRVKLERGDILMTRIGDIGTVKYINWDLEASFYVSLALIKQSEKINSLFLSHYINTNIFQKELHQRIIHVAFPKKINLGEIGNCLVNSPCDKEQTKIASFLTAIDEKISQLTKKHELLTQYKKGVMQNIFSRELRFKDDDGSEFPEWTTKKVKEITDVVVGSTPSTSNSEFWCNGTIPWISSGELNNGIIKSPVKHITELALKKCSVKIMPIETTVLAMTGATLGKVGFLSFETTGNQSVAGFLPNKKFYSKFLFYSLLNNKNQVLTLAGGGAQQGINKSNIESLEFNFPTIKEQTIIANFLTAIDEKISHSQSQLELVKQYKQGLLQQMFV